MYMAGCLVAPFVSTAVASSSSSSSVSLSVGPTAKWSLFYLAPLGLGVLNLGLVVFAFRDSLGLKRRARSTGAGAEGDGAVDAAASTRESSAVKEMWATLSLPSVWVLSLYFFFFLGAVITAGGESSSLRSN